MLRKRSATPSGPEVDARVLAATHAGIGLLTASTSGRLLYVNRELAAIYDHDSVDAMLAARPTLEDLGEEPSHLRAVVQRTATRTEQEVEFRATSMARRRLHVRLQLRRVATSQQDPMLVGTAVDVTAGHALVGGLAASRYRWELLLEAAAVGILVVDASGRVRASNGPLRRLTGSPAEVGSDCYELVHPDDRHVLRAALTAAAAPHARPVCRVRMVTPAGHQAVSLELQHLPDEHQRMQEYLVVVSPATRPTP